MFTRSYENALSVKEAAVYLLTEKEKLSVCNIISTVILIYVEADFIFQTTKNPRYCGLDI